MLTREKVHQILGDLLHAFQPGKAKQPHQVDPAPFG